MTEKDMLTLYKPVGKIDIVLDTDTYNETDDQYAIAYLLANKDRLNIKGFTVAPFENERLVSSIGEGQKKSKEEIIKILKLSGNTEYIDKIYSGSTEFLKDEQTPVLSDAVNYLIEESKNYNKEKRLYVVGIGAITNVASAIIKEPDIVDRICIVWLGGASFDWWINAEYNMYQDYAAARVVMGSKAPFVHVPAHGVINEFCTSKYELEHWLNGKNKLSTYLYEKCVQVAESNTKYKAWSRVIWDVVAIAWLINDDNRFMYDRIENRYLPEYEGNKYNPNRLDDKMCVVHQINRDALMTDMFEKLSQGECK